MSHASSSLTLICLFAIGITPAVPLPAPGLGDRPESYTWTDFTAELITTTIMLTSLIGLQSATDVFSETSYETRVFTSVYPVTTHTKAATDDVPVSIGGSNWLPKPSTQLT